MKEFNLKVAKHYLLSEIKINKPGTSILWGRDNDGRFTELVKLQGFSTSQEALDRINKLLNLEDEPYEEMEYVSYPSYAYLSGDGQVTFVKDLSEFGVGYETEEGWGVKEWSVKPPS
jgi:hypothetical protein